MLSEKAFYQFSPPRPRLRVQWKWVTVLAFMSFWQLHQHFTFPASSLRVIRGYDNVHNRTLGVRLPWEPVTLELTNPWQFEKVFVINLKARTDKLDAIQLSSSITGFQVDVIEGVNGTDVSNKTLPHYGNHYVCRKAFPTSGYFNTDREGYWFRGPRLRQCRRLLAGAHELRPTVRASTSHPLALLEYWYTYY